MSNLWDAELELEPYEAQMLVEMQFQHLAPAKMVPFGTGWDNWAYLVNDTYVVRFPRREIAVPWIMNEAKWLPRLAPLLPLEIPNPELIGEPEGPYPWEFAGYKKLDGVTACQITWDADKRMRAAEPLGRFVRALHEAHPEEAGEDVPQDTIDRAVMPHRVASTRERLDKVVDRIPEHEAIIRQMTELAKAAPHQGPPCWVHGDLYTRHVLVDGNGVPTGVIDWGDLHVGDPALDLMLGYILFDEPSRAVFFDTYGEVDEAAHDRARFRALFYAVALMVYGVDISDEALQRTSRDIIANALQ